MQAEAARINGCAIRILGPMSVVRNGAPVPLPRSRKVRALLGFLALAPSPVSRSRLCDLLWDVPNDPRGELRWCLSKLRSLLDDGDRRRVLATDQDLVALDLSDCFFDASEVASVTRAGFEQVPSERLAELCGLFGGDLLDGMQIESPRFYGWLLAERQRFRAIHVALRTELASRSAPGSPEAFRHLEAWLELAPFDQRAHEVMLDALVRCGRVRDAEEHVNAAIRSFEQEGLDWSSLRAAWRAARAASADPPRLEAASVTAVTAAPEPDPRQPRRRASVAVMPFAEAQSAGAEERIADGLTEDIITRLAKLRVLFVIARGTVFALGERGIGAQEAGRILNVEYVVTGSVRRAGGSISIVVELAETEDHRIVWTDEIAATAQQALPALDAVADRVVAAIAEEIEAAEVNRAILKQPSSLDAWGAYHCGLWHMYRFNGPDNAHAEGFFRRALALDPTFSRAHAGLSFTHFQNVFLDLTPDRRRQIDLALEAAGQSLNADERDPAAHWAMGRALWLRGELGESVMELERSIELSPNFALGHYMLSFVNAQTGDPRAAIEAANYSRELSPFDPLQFAMLASRALAHVRLGEFEEAAAWAVRAVGRPNAHTHISGVAVACLSLAERHDEARKLVARIRDRLPAYGVEDFLKAFRFERDVEDLFRKGAWRVGFGPGE